MRWRMYKRREKIRYKSDGKKERREKREEEADREEKNKGKGGE